MLEVYQQTSELILQIEDKIRRGDEEVEEVSQNQK
jgi:hypothetical protein